MDGSTMNYNGSMVKGKCFKKSISLNIINGDKP